MSVGKDNPRSQGTPSEQVAPQRLDPRNPRSHRVSFKTTKTKSKAKYLTVSEMKGIILSVLLSFLIATTLIFVGMRIVPIFLQRLTDFMISMLQETKFQEQIGLQQNYIYSNILSVRTDMNCSYFSREIEDKVPSIFQTSISEEISYLSWELFTATLLATKKITLLPLSIAARQVQQDQSNEQIENVSEITMPLEEFLQGEFSLNSDIARGNYWVNDDIFGKSDPKLKSLLETNFLPESSESEERCGMRFPPLREFLPVLVTACRNTSYLSGGPFHAHRRSASLLLNGRKRWIIFPPTQVHQF